MYMYVSMYKRYTFTIIGWLFIYLGESVQRFKTEGVHVFRKEKGDLSKNALKRYYIPVLLSPGHTNSTGRPGIQCCVCSITTMSVMAVMACAFLASNRDGKHSLFNHIFNSTTLNMHAHYFPESDSDINIGRPRRSIGYPQHGKALSVHSIFEFLLQISPTIVMFAFAITTYCKQLTCM